MFHFLKLENFKLIGKIENGKFKVFSSKENLIIKIS